MAGFPEAARRAAAHVVVEDLDAPALDAGDARHLGSALRLRAGEEVSATDGRGGWRLCRFGPGGVLEASGNVERFERPAPALCVGFAPVKGDRNEWAIQKLTELGIDRIMVIRSERSVVRWDGARAAAHVAKLGVVARQALMQSRGLWLPEIEGVVDVAAAASMPGVALADPGGASLSLSTPTVLVGPEGGWSEPEMLAGSPPVVSLGPGVLRTETAAVAAGVLLAALRSGTVAPA